MDSDKELLEKTLVTRKKALKTLLKNHVLDIKFTKLDGTERKMRCTLMDKYLPDKTIVNEEYTAKDESVDNRNVVSVWDLEQDGWRSFRLTSVLDMDVTE